EIQDLGCGGDGTTPRPTTAGSPRRMTPAFSVPRGQTRPPIRSRHRSYLRPPILFVKDGNDDFRSGRAQGGKIAWVGPTACLVHGPITRCKRRPARTCSRHRGSRQIASSQQSGGVGALLPVSGAITRRTRGRIFGGSERPSPARKAVAGRSTAEEPQGGCQKG